MSDRTFRRPIQWVTGQRSDVGRVRKLNEDAIMVDAQLGLWAVADGMGGHAVGDVASKMIVDALEKASNDARLSDFVDQIENTVITVNNDILDYAARNCNNATMGSTLIALAVRGRVGVCLWAGDSRLYRLRNNQLTQLSRDHSHVQELIEIGAIKPEDAENHPHGNVITRAVGVEEDGFVDINIFNTQIGDTFLLCSDGLYNTVPNDKIVEFLSQKDAQKSAEDLINASLDGGAPDNVSVVVVKGEPGQLEQ